MVAEHAAGTGGIFFLRANSYTISYEYYARTNTEQLRRDVDMGMKALVEEAAANSGGSAGAGKDWGHGEIRQCAWWPVALATLLLLD